MKTTRARRLRRAAVPATHPADVAAVIVRAVKAIR